MLRGGLNLGMSGVPLWGSDVTGFKCITDFPYDKEMYLRWAAVGAVSPIMMEQNACANPLGRRQKWKLWDDEETVRVYADMARLHTRLMPYFEVLIRQSNRSGAPIMRHPFLHHPREPEAWKAESSFYLGASLWAAPVVERFALTKDTWLPPGKWVDLADRAVYEGGRRVTLPAPLARLPLLLRDGGIVPLLDASIETLAPATVPGIVTLDHVKDRLDVLVALSSGRDATDHTRRRHRARRAARGGERTAERLARGQRGRARHVRGRMHEHERRGRARAPPCDDTARALFLRHTRGRDPRGPRSVGASRAVGRDASPLTKAFPIRARP